jgi:hypothetical protein
MREMIAIRITEPVSNGQEDKFAPYERMATTIVELTKKNGGCLPQDMLQHGFTTQETLELWHMANAMAEVELKLMENKNVPGRGECAMAATS